VGLDIARTPSHTELRDFLTCNAAAIKVTPAFQADTWIEMISHGVQEGESPTLWPTPDKSTWL